MKPSHEILPSVIDALKFWGPLTPSEISAQLISRGEFIPALDIAIVCEQEVTTRPGGISRIALCQLPATPKAPGSFHLTYKVAT